MIINVVVISILKVACHNIMFSSQFKITSGKHKLIFRKMGYRIEKLRTKLTEGILGIFCKCLKLTDF